MDRINVALGEQRDIELGGFFGDAIEPRHEVVPDRILSSKLA